MNNFNKPVFKTNVKDLDKNTIDSIIKEHKNFKSKYNYNYDYFIGNHKILYKTMEDPSKPNNKIISNLPSFTVDIRTGYFSGEPITFTSGNEKQQEAILDILEYNDFQDTNSELDKLSAIYGHAFLILWIDEEGQTRMAAESPDNIILVHDNSLAANPIGAIRYFEYKDAANNNTILEMTVFKKDKIQYFSGSQSNLILIKEEPNYFGDIPVIEFIENTERKSCYQDAISIVDAIEDTISSSMNEIEYFDNAYLHLKNLAATETADIQDMKNNRVLLTEADGEAEFLIKNINDTYIQNMLNRLTTDYHKLTKTPALTDESFSGNASGVALKFKLFGLEKDMSKKESKWKKSLQRMLELINNRLNMIGGSYDYKEIKITFTRALPTNALEQAELVSKLTGIVSNETLLSQLDFIEKPKEEYEKVQEEKKVSFDDYNFNDIQVAYTEKISNTNKSDSK
jgi:SPP1 family phage portal protein